MQARDDVEQSVAVTQGGAHRGVQVVHVAQGEHGRLLGRGDVVAQLGEPGTQRVADRGVLDTVLRARQHFGGERRILVGRGTALHRAGEAARAHGAPIQPGQALGARADEGALAAPEAEHEALRMCDAQVA